VSKARFRYTPVKNRDPIGTKITTNTGPERATLQCTDTEGRIKVA
jgi:hypothetical protein